MNYLDALELIEDGKIVGCNETSYLYKKNGSEIMSKLKNEKNWNVALIYMNIFANLTFKEYKEPQIPLDTPMDAPILVSSNGINWLKRHFKCLEKSGEAVVWDSGCTSYTAEDEFNISTWKYAKLPKEDE